MSRLSDTEAIARRPLSKGYQQKMIWNNPSDLRPDQSLHTPGAFMRATGVGEECLSGASAALAKGNTKGRA